MSKTIPPFERSDFCIKRTPQELDLFFNKYYQLIKTNEELKCQARLKKEPFKTFIEELRPFSIFCNNRLMNQDGVSCMLSDANKNHDAVILKNNRCVTVEITWPTDGKEEYEDAKNLNERGFASRIWDYSDYEIHENLITRVETTASKKERIDYNNTDGSILLIVIDEIHFDQVNTCHQKLLEKLRKNLSLRSFKVQETSLLFLLSKQSVLIQGEPAI